MKNTSEPKRTLLDAAKTEKADRMAEIKQRAEVAAAYFRGEVSGPDAAKAIGGSKQSIASRLGCFIGTAIKNGVARVEFNGGKK